MEKLVLTILFSLASISIGAQNKISFAYDSCGNRINKTIVLTKSSVSETVIPFVEMIGEKEIRIYPNPTRGQLKVEVSDFDKIKSGSLTIYSLQGKLIKSKKINNTLTDIDISSSSSGVYIMQINVDNEISTWKIIKE